MKDLVSSLNSLVDEACMDVPRLAFGSTINGWPDTILSKNYRCRRMFKQFKTLAYVAMNVNFQIGVHMMENYIHSRDYVGLRFNSYSEFLDYVWLDKHEHIDWWFEQTHGEHTF